MAAFTRSVGGRRFPQTNTASCGALVLNPAVQGTYTAPVIRIYPQLSRFAMPIRQRTFQSFGTTAAPPVQVSSAARVARKSALNTIIVFGI